MGRPNEYDRKNQTTIRMYLDLKEKKEYQKLLIDEDSSVQQDLYKFIQWRLNNKRSDSK